MKKIQRKTITVEILTRASAPLELSPTELESLIDGMERAFKDRVDLRYHPDGNRYLEDHHEFLGIDFVEVQQ